MNEVSWKPDNMLEVALKEPDDFLKVRETLSRIGVASGKKKHYFSLVIYCTSKVNITLYILKNYLH